MKLGIMKDEQGNRIKGDTEYIMRDEDKALIPCNKANADYVAYLADKDKVVEDFDYAKEETRQLKAAEEKKEADDKETEIQKELRAMAMERIKAREE